MIGIAVDSKKKLFFEGFDVVARGRGFITLYLDVSLPIESQVIAINDNKSHLDCIIIKFRGDPSLLSHVTEYLDSHPETIAIESQLDVATILDRRSMLKAFHEYDGKYIRNELIRTPKSIMVEFGMEKNVVEALVCQSNINYPLILKPLKSTSHDIYVALSLEALLKFLVVCPDGFIVEEYYEHGGIIFKVFVIGDAMSLVVRPAPKISCCSQDSLFLLDRSIIDIKNYELNEIKFLSPSKEFLRDIVSIARSYTKLDLLGIDFIRSVHRDSKNNCLTKGDIVIFDMNYFPGYDGVDIDVFESLLNLIVSRIKK